MAMRLTTLCFLLKDNEILQAMKKTGFGTGKWNGVGGKVEVGETISQAAARELNEEIGVRVNPEGLENAGNIKVYFPENPGFDQHMHIFLARDWDGEPVETAEMKPQWFGFGDIPYSSMWVDDEYWLPKVLLGKKIEASFYFKGGGESFDKHEVKEI